MTATALRPDAVVPEKLLTADEYFALPSSVTEGTELVEGKIVSKYGDDPMSGPGAVHGKIVVRISGRLEVFASGAGLGDVYTETGFVLTEPVRTMKRPDVAFLGAARLPAGTPTGFIEGAPDLAVEVLSPNDLWSQTRAKVKLYFANGAQLVWVVDPEERELTVHTPDGMSRTFRDDAEVSAEPVLPGFVLRLREIWP